MTRMTALARSLGSLTGRVFIGTALIVAVVIGAAFVITSASVRRAGEASARHGLEQSADLVAQFLAGRSRSLAGGARVFVQGPYFRALVAERRGDDITDQSIEASEQLDADWVFITDDRGVMLAKSDEPGARGLPMGNVPLVAGALRGLVTSGFGVSRDSLLFQAIAVPIVTPGRAPMGVLVATRLVDSALVRDVKATTSSELVFYTTDARGARRVSLATLALTPDVHRAIDAVMQRNDDDAGARPDSTRGPTGFLAQGSTLTTAGGDVIGGFVVLRSRDAELADLASLRRSLAIAGGLGLLLAWLAAFVAARRVARPVSALARAVRQASEGEFDVKAQALPVARGAGHEIVALGEAFRALLGDLRDKERLTGLAPFTPARPAVDESPHDLARDRPRGGGPTAPRARLAVRPAYVLEPGQILSNRYLIDAVIGSGGLGIVYRARDRVLGEQVAVKLLRPDVMARDDQAAHRLADEIRVARRVSHRNVVRVHDIGESNGVMFLTMEYVDGASLATVIENRGALPAATVRSVARQLMRALAVMHGEGVVHGDIKPANLLLGPGGVLKLSDFGIARVVRDAARDARDDTRADAVGQLSGGVVGTPEYMAPEQPIGAPPTVASDIYAAGIVLHECLTGATPFDAETRVTFLAHKMDATPVSTPAVPSMVTPSSALEAVILRMMAPTPGDRPASAAALFEEFVAIG